MLQVVTSSPVEPNMYRYLAAQVTENTLFSTTLWDLSDHWNTLSEMPHVIEPVQQYTVHSGPLVEDQVLSLCQLPLEGHAALL